MDLGFRACVPGSSKGLQLDNMGLALWHLWTWELEVIFKVTEDQDLQKLGFYNMGRFHTHASGHQEARGDPRS